MRGKRPGYLRVWGTPKTIMTPANQRDRALIDASGQQLSKIGPGFRKGAWPTFFCMPIVVLIRDRRPHPPSPDPLPGGFSSMLRILLYVLAAIGTLAVIFLGSVAYFAMKAVNLVDEAAVYASETVERYGVSWDESVLLERASEEMIAAVRANPSGLSGLSSLMKDRGGTLESQQEATCSNFRQNVSSESGQVMLASCAVNARLSQADARFDINLVYRNGSWRLLGFFAHLNIDTTDRSTQVSYQPAAKDDAGLGKILNSVPTQIVGFSVAEREIIYGRGNDAIITPGIGGSIE